MPRREENEIVSTLFKELDTYKVANQSQRAVLNEIYQAYVGEMSDAKDRSKSQEKITKLRTETNYIVPSIFSGSPELEVEKVGEEDKDLAFVGEKIVNHRLNTIPQAYEKIEAWVKQAVVFGTSLISVNWEFETEDDQEERMVRNEETGMLKSKIVPFKRPVKDEPNIAVHNILDSFYNPIISDVECQNSIIFRSVLPVAEVQENLAYDYKENGKENRKLVKSRGSMQVNQYDSTQQVSNDKINLQKAAEGVVEVYERITEERIQTVADGAVRLVLRDVENPYHCIPAIKFIYEPSAIPDRFDGYGVGQNTLGLGRLYQKMQNRSLDSVALTNNPFFAFAKGAVADKRQLVVKVGGGVEVDLKDGKSIKDAITPIQFPDVMQGAIAMMNKIEDEHKRASGANDLIQGAASNKTLGQDQIASTYSSNRFELINRRFKQALADLGRTILKMEIQNIQSIDAPILKIFPLEAEMTADGRIQYSRETVFKMLIQARESKDLDFNIRVKGETNIAKNKDIQVKQLIELFNIFGPALQPQYQIEWARKILALRGVDEISKLLPDAETMQEQAQQQEMQAMNPQGMQPGLAPMTPIP